MADATEEIPIPSSDAPVEIRTLRPSDSEAFAQFAVAAGVDPSTADQFPAHPLNREFARELFARPDADLDRFFAVFVGSRIVASAEIPRLSLCVHPELQGAGIGQHLLRHVSVECRRADSGPLTVSVPRGNSRALHVYRKFGFDFVSSGGHEIAGTLDPAFAPAPKATPLNLARIGEWHAGRERPFRLGIWCAYGETLLPHSGIGLFTYELIDALLATRPDVQLCVAVRAGDDWKVQRYSDAFPGRFEVLSNTLPDVMRAEEARIRALSLTGRYARWMETPARRLGTLNRPFIGMGRRWIGGIRRIGRAILRTRKWHLIPALLLAVALLPFAALAALIKRLIARAGKPILGLHAASIARATDPIRYPVDDLQPMDYLLQVSTPYEKIRKAGCDAWVYPFLGVPFPLDDHASIYFIHDLVTSRFPETVRLSDVLDSENLVRHRIREATRIACMSDYIRQNDLIGMLGLQPGRIRMVLPAIPTVALSEGIDRGGPESRSPFGSPYFFYPAGLRAYKNHTILIDAVALLAEESIRVELAFTGGNESQHLEPLRNRAAAKGVSDRIHFLGNVSRNRLTELYLGAAGTIVPSLYEQGSFPIYESIGLGTPVACSNIPPLREQCAGFGAAMLHFDPLDAGAVRDAMKELLAHRAEYAEAQRAAAKRCWTRTWSSVAEQWLAVFRQAAHSFRHPAAPPRNRDPEGPFRIGVWLDVDGQTLEPTEGIGVFTYSWLRGLMKLDEPIELTLLVHPGKTRVIESLLADFPGRIRVAPGPHQRLADTARIAQQQDCHIWLLPFAGLGLKLDVPYAVMLHDVVTKHYPGGFDPDWVARYEAAIAMSVRDAELVVCESDIIASIDARQLLGVPESKLRVVYAATPDLEATSDGAPPSERIARLTRPFLFYPAAVRPYKNHRMLLHALRVLKEDFGDTTFDVVFTGPNVTELPEDLKLILDHGNLWSQVHFLGRVNRESIYELYRKAHALVFPTLFEGCGLPIFEALKLDCPIACSDIPILREQFDALGDSLVYFDPLMPISIARAILKLRDHRGAILAAQRAAAPRFQARDWTHVAAEWLALMKENTFGKAAASDDPRLGMSRGGTHPPTASVKSNCPFESPAVV